MINQQAKIYLKIIQKMSNPNTRNPTEEELNTLQEHLSPIDFEMLLEEITAMHGIEIEDTLKDIPTTDPRWYFLE